MHSCLRYNKDKISEKCRNEEMKLAAIEYRDIRLRSGRGGIAGETSWQPLRTGASG